jgi:hypothetical protein
MHALLDVPSSAAKGVPPKAKINAMPERVMDTRVFFDFFSFLLL